MSKKRASLSYALTNALEHYRDSRPEMFFCSAKKVITWKYLGGSLLFNKVVGLYEFRTNAKTTSNNSQYLLWCYNFKKFLGYSQKQPLEVLYKKAVLKDMVKFVTLRLATLLKKRLQDRCFPMNFEKKFKNSFS